MVASKRPRGRHDAQVYQEMPRGRYSLRAIAAFDVDGVGLLLWGMPQYSVTFKNGSSLEISDASKSQQGLVVAENVDLRRRDVLRKRPGARLISRVRSADPNDLIPVEELRAIWSRGNEIVLEGYDQLYSFQSCAQGAPGSQNAGTATPSEISDSQAVLANITDEPKIFDVALPGDATAPAARTRADRPDFPVVLTITPPGRSITITVDETSPANLAWTAVELATTNGPNALTGTVQRIPRMQDIKQFSVRDEVLLTWVADGVLLTLTMTVAAGDAQFTTVAGTLEAIRGPQSLSRYESRENTVVYFSAGGVLRVRRAENPADIRSFFVTNPPAGSPGNGYSIDHTSALFPAVNMAAVWIDDADNKMHAVDLVPGTSTVADEQQTGNLRAFTARNVGIEVGAQRSIAMGAPGLSLSPVWQYVVGQPIEVVDLGGGDLRLTITAVGTLRHDLRNASTQELLSVAQAEVDGGFIPAQAQWLVSGDTIYGVVLKGLTLAEARWRRSFDLATVDVDASTKVTRFGLSQSASRFALGYWSAPQIMRVRLIDDIDDFTPRVVNFPTLQVYQDGGLVASAVLAELVGADALVRMHSWITPSTVYSVSLDTQLGTLADERVDTWGDLPEFVSAIAAGASPRTMLGVQYPTSSIEVWEVSPTVFVRVSPPLIVPPGGDWLSRGKWTRTTARVSAVEDHGSATVVSVDAATVANSSDEPCAIVVSEVAGKGAIANIVSTHTESDIVLDATGKRPRAASLDRNRVQVTYEAATRELFTAVWERSALAFSTLGITLTTDRVWDQTAAEVQATAMAAWATVNNPGDLQIDILPDVGVAAMFVRSPGFLSFFDCGIHLEPVPGSLTDVWVTWAVIGLDEFFNPKLQGSIELYESDTGVMAPVFVRTVNLADTPHAVACATLDGLLAEVWLEVVLGPNRRVQLWDLESGSDALVETQKRAALASQLATLNGATVGAISLLGTAEGDADSPDPDTFVGGTIFRSGVLLKNIRDNEIVGRLAIGRTETIGQRTQRSAKASLDLDATGALDLGWQELGPALEAPKATKAVRYRWNPNVGAHNPAVVDSMVVSPHGGYPRQYGGRVIHEHDWHELPEIVSVTVAAGGSLSMGNYLVAITWRGLDETGKLARSRPTAPQKMVVIAAGQRIDVVYRGLAQTERPFVVAEIWRSEANGLDLRLDQEAVAVIGPIGTDNQLVQLVKADADLGDEVLDQGDAPGQVIPSDPIAITDFTAAANGRIWSRDVRNGGTVRFSTSPRPGFAAHWSLAFVAHHQAPDDLTAAAAMDGRVVLLSKLNASATYGDGPDNNGAGVYAIPARVPVDIGAASQASLALIPEGLVYSPGVGLPVQLLSRTYTSAPLGERVSASFYRDGADIIASAFVRQSDTLHLLDGRVPGAGTQSLRFNFSTLRWGTDSGRQGLDLTVPHDGQLVILTTDGRVLFEQLDRHDSGGLGYVTRMSTPWLHGQGGRLTALGNFQSVHVIGKYEGSHKLVIEVFLNYATTPTETAEISASAIDQHAADGEIYAYEYTADLSAWALRVQVSDGGEPNPTFSLERIVVQSSTEQLSPTPAGLPPGHTFNQVP